MRLLDETFDRNLEDMNNPTPQTATAKQSPRRCLTGILHSTFATLTLASSFCMFGLATSAAARELPSAPMPATSSSVTTTEAFTPNPGFTAPAESQPKLVDRKFVALAIVSSGSAFSDSYTTLFARENWLAGKKNVCNEEVESAYLYGTHPTVARTYAVASVKSAGSILAAYYLRKHHSKLWSIPLIATSASSLQGVTQNMITCN